MLSSNDYYRERYETEPLLPEGYDVCSQCGDEVEIERLTEVKKGVFTDLLCEECMEVSDGE